MPGSLFVVGVIGSHGYAHLSGVRAAVALLCAQPGLQLLTRGRRCPVDRAVRLEARRHRVPVAVVRKAGTHGAVHMLVAGCDRLIAFWDGRSEATRHAIQLAHATGVPVVVHRMIE